MTRAIDRSKLLRALWVWLMLACAPALQAQTTNLDDLQKQLDQARQQKAAQQPKPAPAAKRSEEPRPAAAATGRQATLVIEADAACELRVDGVSKGRLSAGRPVSVVVEAGKQLIDCISSEVADVKVREVVDVKAGTKEVVSIGFGSAIESLRDSKTGLTWTRADNGSDIDWNGAKHWCAAKGGGWELPTVAELRGLYDANVPGIACGSARCKVTVPLQLTSYWFWSREADSLSQARYVLLGLGVAASNIVGYSVNTRALCVRRS